MSQYAVVIERAGSSFGAYVPDLPGCVAVADSRQEVERLIAEAILLHIDELRRGGDSIPSPTTLTTTVEA